MSKTPAICICCHSPFRKVADTDSCCGACVKKVMRHNALRNTCKRVGKSKLEECPECKTGGIKTVLGVRAMRVHRYDRHSFNFRLGRVVKKGAVGRPRKVV